MPFDLLINRVFSINFPSFFQYGGSIHNVFHKKLVNSFYWHLFNDRTCLFYEMYKPLADISIRQ